jgi:lipopolysaccharide transport system ATP-binding protein
MIEFTDLKFSSPGQGHIKPAAPDASIIGVIEEGPEWLVCGNPAGDTVRLGPGDPLPEIPGNYIFDHALARADAVTKSKAVARIVALRRAGATIALVSHDEALLESCADEIWWIRDGILIARGDPGDVLARYRSHVAEALRSSGEKQAPRLSPTMRSGDGRAALERVELLGENGEPANVFRSGEEVTVRVTVRFASPVAGPVVGIMIRTRIGLNVYGTNTELERLRPGPMEAGDRLRVAYRFRCDLCPGEYTVTAASHDPDGVWHDWMEDAVAFSVCDSRYTAGVANLKARVEVEEAPHPGIPEA